MLVYGDAERIESVGAKRENIEAALAAAMRLPPGIERHAALVAAFIGAGELVQGIIDREFEERGFDARSRSHEIGMSLLVALARSVERSWRGDLDWDPHAASILKGLAQLDSQTSIRTKRAEGYAFYALYPECYLEAAARSGLGPRTQVIGIRSIGAGLGAIVASALNAPTPLTVRPVGHPFHREIRVDPAIAAEIAKADGTTFAIVDEGPGLSGSSFGAVADWLEGEGISPERIHYFPSHAGDPGPRASQAHRDRWGKAARHALSMDQLLLQRPGRQSLRNWVEEVVGPLDRPLDALSHGSWRGRRYASEMDWPAADLWKESRKFLARAGGKEWLVKFIGLDEESLQKIRRARLLQQAGFTPDVAGYRYGFILERWYDDARPLDGSGFDRKRLVEQVGAYLGFRARRFPSENGRGASLAQLLHMARYNVQQALGDAAAAVLERRMPESERLEGKVRRVDTDNRMHSWEWLVLDGRLLKTDALDHSSNHDLVGHQDIAWDVAGATIELALSQEETDRLCTIVGHGSGHPVDPEILALMIPCYLGFQIGAHVMAADALGEGHEATRLRREADRYASILKHRLGDGPEVLTACRP